MTDRINIPAFDLKRQIENHRREFLDAMERIVDSGGFILGREVQSFENEAAQFLGARYAVSCASGTDALQLALMTLDLEEGDEIITTPFTFLATVDVIVLLKLKPVFVDINPDTYNLDNAAVPDAVTDRTRVIMPVHLYGRCVPMDEVMGIAVRHHLQVIEDCAQAIGAEFKGKKVGTFGECGCFSFYPTKNLGGFGDGGLVTTNDESLAKKLRALRTHGQVQRYTSEFIGINSRLDALQAAILRTKLSFVNQWNKRRRAIAARYNENLKDLSVKTPSWNSDSIDHVFHQYSIQIEERDALRSFLASKGIGTVIYYPVPLHLQPAFQNLGYSSNSFPVSERVSQTILSLPMFPELTDEEIDIITDAVCDFYNNRE